MKALRLLLVLSFMLSVVQSGHAEDSKIPYNDPARKAKRQADAERNLAASDAAKKTRADLMAVDYPQYAPQLDSGLPITGTDELSGQVFIATRGGENVKLGLVRVRVLSPAQIAALNEWLKSDAVKATWGDAADRIKAMPVLYRHMMEEWLADRKWEKVWLQLPESSIATLTDADGNFTLKGLPSDSYCIVAAASRLIGGKTEHYFWLIASADVVAQQPLLLSNHNMYSMD